MTTDISVLTTLFNHEDFIRDSLLSALEQSHPPGEIVVIDDGSTDASVEKARSVVSPIIRIASEKLNLGGPNTVKGLAMCSGELVAILNSDDRWRPSKLEKQIQYLRDNPNCGVIFTRVALFDESGVLWEGDPLGFRSLFAAPNRNRQAWLRHFFCQGNAFCVSSAVVRRECLSKVGPLDGRYVQLQDFDLWLRIALAGYDIHVVDEQLTEYRLMRGRSNMSAPSLENLALHAFEMSKILRHFWQIKTLAELQDIFPEIKVAAEAPESLVLYYLAQHAAQQPNLHHQLFSLETMSKWGGNLASMASAAQLEGFGYIAYREFLSRKPFRAALRESQMLSLARRAASVLPGFCVEWLRRRWHGNGH